MKTLETQEYLIDQMPNITGATRAAIDLEMFGQDKERLHIPHGKFACLSVALDNGRNYIYTNTLVLDEVFWMLKPLQWIIQNATYDIRQLRQFVKIEPHPIFDPMLVEKVLWGGYYVTFGLSSMVRRYLGLYMAKDKYEELQDESINREELFQYNVQDAVLTLKVAEIQQALLEEQPDTKKVYEIIDAPMIWVVLDMEPTRVNIQGWLELATENESKGRSIEAEIGLNVYAYTKVKDHLALHYGLRLENTQDEMLAEYKHIPIIQKIREARSYRKMSSTYGRKWVEKHCDEDGNVVADWHVTGAETGRQSSSNPSLMNIPAAKMPIFRTLFIPRYDQMIVADVSQQEPRITALMSKDKALVKAFNDHEDIHLFIARTIFDDFTIQKSDIRRKIGKRTGLGIVYGFTAVGLSSKLKEEIDDPTFEINEDKAQEYIDAYFRKFPRVKIMLDQLVAFGHRHEYVTTAFGRRCWINIHAMGWENNCKNSPFQGGGADMTKLWQVKLWERCRNGGHRYPLVMPIHDELVLDVSDDEVPMYLDLLDVAFKETIQILFPDSPIPFEFEHFEGANWGVKA